MKTFYLSTLDGEVLTWQEADEPQQPLDKFGVAATLNVVLGLWTLSDACNATGFSPEQLILEAQAWALGEQHGD